jgi:hypothetical protein
MRPHPARCDRRAVPAYEIRIAGRLEDEQARALGLVVVRRTEETVLHGKVADQAHFLGLIERVRDLGLELLEARRAVVPEDEAG